MSSKFRLGISGAVKLFSIEFKTYNFSFFIFLKYSFYIKDSNTSVQDYKSLFVIAFLGVKSNPNFGRSLRNYGFDHCTIEEIFKDNTIRSSVPKSLPLFLSSKSEFSCLFYQIRLICVYIWLLLFLIDGFLVLFPCE